MVVRKIFVMLKRFIIKQKAKRQMRYGKKLLGKVKKRK